MSAPQWSSTSGSPSDDHRYRVVLPARLARLIDRVGEPRAMPTVVGRALRCIDDPASSSAQLAAILNTDQTLAGRLIGIANSAFYTGAQRFVTVHGALVRIGYRAARDFVLAAAVSGLSRAPLHLYGLAPGELWWHSLAAAVGARVLARGTGQVEPEHAYVAGLVHDLGRVMLDRSLPRDQIAAIQDLVRTRQVYYQAAEESVLGVSHAEVGAYQLSRWGIDADTVEAVASHHAPQPAGLSAIVHAADVLSILALRPESSVGWQRSVAPEVAASLGKALGGPATWEERLDELVSTVRVGMQEASLLLGEEAGASPDGPAVGGAR